MMCRLWPSAATIRNARSIVTYSRFHSIQLLVSSVRNGAPAGSLRLNAPQTGGNGGLLSTSGMDGNAHTPPRRLDWRGLRGLRTGADRAHVWPLIFSGQLGRQVIGSFCRSYGQIDRATIAE